MRGIHVLGEKQIISEKGPYLIKLISALIIKSFPLLPVMQNVIPVPNAPYQIAVIKGN
jgi:hypothetical protein